MNEELIRQAEALDRWEAGILEIEELEALNRSLESPEARRRLLDQWLIDRALPQTLSKATIRERHRQEISGESTSVEMEEEGEESSRKVVRMAFSWRRSLWGSLGSAAAGLVLGAFGASLVFGKVGVVSKRVVEILQEGFESGESPLVTGVPRSPGVWSGDFGAVVTEQAGVQPHSGQRMFQFLRADYEGKPPQFSYTGDLYRMIDLQGQDLGSGDSEALVVVEASIRSIPFQEKDRYRANLWLYAFEKMPTFEGSEATWPFRNEKRPSAGKGPGASAHRDLALNHSGKDWEKLRVEMRVPPGTRYLMLSIHVVDLVAERDSKREGAVEFPGQFLDDVRVSLVRDVGGK